jgi:hypothetical protein
MTMQLDTSEVQIAVTTYLRSRGVIIEDPCQVRLEIVDRLGTRLNFAGCTAVVVVSNVKLTEEPYR